MSVHQLKTWPAFYEALISRTKTFEIRKNDRGFQVGDTLVLQEYLPEAKKYTSRLTVRVVTYIMKGNADMGLHPDYCIMGIREV